MKTLVRRVPALVVLFCIALFVAGAGTALFGFFAIGYDEPLRVTAGFITAGAVLMAASIALTVAIERQLRADEKRALAGQEATAPKVARKPKKHAPIRADALLGEWTLAPDEWRAFVEQEADRRRRGAWEPALLGAAFGGVVPWIFTGSWRYSLIGAPLIAAIAFAVALVLAARMRKRVPQAGGRVIVRRNAVEIDGDVRQLGSDKGWLTGARMLTDLPLPVMELTVSSVRYERNGSRRAMAGVIRVPVSRAREADARRICDELRSGIVDHDEV
ncbi:MAG TPA: hypothetical protein VF092_26040 [Longimicrobium sp.]